jgi:sugar transferase EpsL
MICETPTGTMRADRLKRSFDVVGAVLALLFFAPLILFAVVYIYVTMGRPFLFRQQRTGRHGRSFQVWKFRTMREGCDLPDAARLTPAGLLLRRWSIDELPQLFNVLCGDMSLVGPRPLLPEYVAFYNPVQRTRLDVRPGITGWAQVHGRNALSWQRKLRLDAWYVQHRSNLLDLAILIQTVRTVLSREGISADGHATATRFYSHLPLEGSTPQ